MNPYTIERAKLISIGNKRLHGGNENFMNKGQSRAFKVHQVDYKPYIKVFQQMLAEEN